MKRNLILLTGIILVGLSVRVYAAHNIPTDPFTSAGPDAIPQLMEMAASDDPSDMDLRIRAIQRLGELKSAEAVPIIIDSLGYGSEAIIRQAGGARVFTWRVRVVSAKALAEIGDERAIAPLSRRVWYDEDNTVRRAAVQALGLMGEAARRKETLEFLHSILERTQDNALAADICEALGKIGDKASFVPLLRVTQGRFLNYTKEQAQKGIAQLKWHLPSVFDDDPKAAAYE
jgi:HEAT repeat protein